MAYNERHWQELCELAENEKDGARLLELTKQVLELFEERQRQRKGAPPERGTDTPRREETWESMT
jgi:hypothetical protein